MDSTRKTTLVAGALHLLTLVSIPTSALYGPIRDPDFVAGSGSDTGVIIGGVLEMIAALACIGTAVVLLLRRPTRPAADRPAASDTSGQRAGTSSHPPT